MDEKTADELHEEVEKIRIKIIQGMSAEKIDDHLYDLQQTINTKIKE